jgi:hypothetical protein
MTPQKGHFPEGRTVGFSGVNIPLSEKSIPLSQYCYRCKANINLYTEAQFYIGNTTTSQKNILRPTIKARAEAMLNCRHTISTKQEKLIALTVAAVRSFLDALWRRNTLLVEPLLAATLFPSRL